jgi:hypothetical protein
MNTSRPLHSDDFFYWSARRACYLVACDLAIWRVTRARMKPLKNPKNPTTTDEKEIYLTSRAKSCLLNLLACTF